MILLTFMPINNVTASHKQDTASVERRRESRITTGGVCDIVVINPSSSERLTGMVVDVSRSGLQLELGKLIESGSIIEVQLRTLIISGQVESCRQHGSSCFRVGVITGRMIDSVLARCA